jgi:hypothetical protein
VKKEKDEKCEFREAFDPENPNAYMEAAHNTCGAPKAIFMPGAEPHKETPRKK